MLPILNSNIPWYFAGPMFGLLVVGLYALANKPLGVSGAYVQVATFFRDRPRAEMWRVWYFAGLVAGALIAALLRGGPTFGLGYGALGRVVPVVALIPILFVAGMLMGYGARWAGGCTSGHGMCGTSARTPAGFAATITFMLTAIGVAALLHTVTGGAW